MNSALLFLGLLLPAAGSAVTYVKGSDGSVAHQFKNPCKVSVTADPGLIVWKNLYLEPRSYSFPVIVTVAAGWKIVSASYPDPSGQAITLPAPNVGTWRFTVPANLVAFSGIGARLVTVHFATLRQTPAGAPDYQEDIVIFASVVPDLATLDVDGDGLSDAWEQRFFGNVSQEATADFDGDGILNCDEFLRGTSPTDFWNGKPPILTIVSGNGQGDLSGQTLSQPLKVQVTNQDRRAKQGLPVAFSIISPTTGGAILTPGNTKTDTNGIAQSTLKLPSSPPGTIVTVSASIQGASVQFTASIGDPNVSPNAPLDGEVSLQNGDTEASITWSDNSNNETAYYIDRTEDNVSWTRVATLPPNTTSYVDHGLRPGRCYIYVVGVRN